MKKTTATITFEVTFDDSVEDHHQPISRASMATVLQLQKQGFAPGPIQITTTDPIPAESATITELPTSETP